MPLVPMAEKRRSTTLALLTAPEPDPCVFTNLHLAAMAIHGEPRA